MNYFQFEKEFRERGKHFLEYQKMSKKRKRLELVASRAGP